MPYRVKDTNLLSDIHSTVQDAGINLKDIEKCKIDFHAKKLRSEARDFLSKGRRKLRDLKTYINKRSE